MRDNMTVEDAINVVHVLGRDLASNGDEDMGELVSAATWLVSHVQEQAAELERERARRRGTGQRESAMPEGHRLENGEDGGGRRDFLAGRGVHAGETLYLLTYSGWHPVRYESNMPRNSEKVLAWPNFKPSTQHGYQTVLSLHVLPAWRKTPLREIDRLAIQQWVAEKFRHGAGWQTVRNSWVLLSSILESAVEYGYLQANPARGVKFPQKALKQKPRLIAGDDFGKLLKHLNEPYRTMVSLIAATGLRVGELLGLRWGALNLEIGSLAVRESVYEGKFQSPKTQRAFRTIPLGPHAVKALVAHRDRVARQGPADLVFGNRKGGPLRESKVLTKVLQPAAVDAGLGRVTWHQFRHIHSSLLNDLNVPSKIAQEQLGHASISTTLGIYTHAIPASHRDAVEAVEERLFAQLLSNVLESENGLAAVKPVSDSVN